MKKITKAVIPAAGLGTRVLPATKVCPKELIPIVDKPAIQYVVEEAVNSGISDILIILSRGKELIADHFDRTPELEQRLLETGRINQLEEIKRISDMADITFIRQKEIRGLGDAVLKAKSFAAGEDFAVLYADDVIFSKTPVCRQLIEIYERFGKGAVGVKAVPDELVMKYCTLAVTEIEKNIYNCTDMIEKPKKDEIISNFSILGRCILPNEIFGILEDTAPGAGGELQLTDAMAALARKDGITALDFEGKRYDMGNKLGIMKASVENALLHPEIGDEFRLYLKELSKTL